MPKQTIQDRLAAALTARGEREIIPSRSGKYRQFTRKAGGYYWLGAGGALRYGENSSSSYSLQGAGRDAILSGADQANAILAKADAEWLAGHPELAANLEGAFLPDLDSLHDAGDGGFIPGTRDQKTCRCDRCRTIRALRRTAEATATA